MPPKTKLWPLDAHTRAKHSILRKYLQGWLPVIASTESKLVFIDGFAGPGEYTPTAGSDQGPDGSPIIALKALLEHAMFRNGSWDGKQFIFAFIEEDKARAEHLEHVALPRLGSLPSNVLVFSECAAFADAMGSILDTAANLAPTLALVDPFGIGGVPLDLLHRLMGHRKSEMLVTLMVEPINRFKDRPEFVEPMTELLGDAEWRRLIAEGSTPEERLDAITAAYSRRLEAGGRKVVGWPMIKTDGHRIYDMVFATSNIQGMRKIKDAVWSVGGDMGVSVSPRQKLGMEPVPDLESRLMNRFAGTDVTKVALVEFVIMETPYREPHLTEALRSLEQQGVVSAAPRSRARSYPKECTVTFGTGI